MEISVTSIKSGRFISDCTNELFENLFSTQSTKVNRVAEGGFY